MEILVIAGFFIIVMLGMAVYAATLHSDREWDREHTIPQEIADLVLQLYENRIKRIIIKRSMSISMNWKNNASPMTLRFINLNLIT